ncbi:MAG: MlaD family protein [Terriglobales bacterium]
MPSQKQLKWSQLRVGLTVLIASVTLAVLIFLMSGTGGWFTHKITLRSYVDNASELREGAPVRLHGVDIGNVTSVQIVRDKPTTPVEVTMKVNTKYKFNLRKDSVILLSTAGVLGETYVDIDSSTAKGPQVTDGDTLLAHDQPDFQDVVRASQGTLQNMDALLKRLDNIVAFVESGKGSIGKAIYSPALYEQLDATVLEFKGLLDQIQSGKGSLGPLVTSDESYKKALAAIDKINALVDGLQQGKGTAGKLLNDSQLYDNANKTMADVSQLTADINAGKGALGKIARDQEFAARLQTLMTNLSKLSDRLEKGEGTAGMFFNDPALYNNSNQTLVETRELVKAIRENPKKYLTIHMKIF